MRGLGRHRSVGTSSMDPLVLNNTDSRKLQIETSSKSIIVTEDIDCSLELTSQRKGKKEAKDLIQDKKNDEKKRTGRNWIKLSSVEGELIGTLRCCIANLKHSKCWLRSEGERLILFTTNHVEKLDPALIRSGRMDRHIEMWYCKFEAFKVLANNYLDLDSHPLFGAIQNLLEEVDMTPADVAENLMPKTMEEAAGTFLGNLIEAIEIAKEKAQKKKGEKEFELKAEKGLEEEAKK
ncbi:P-loop containing nucleoside triphosphate hydrolases superfamily protein [Actinidia rufa]|uniref:P-loop containing nucleoside triphosphate hydrolases superfamily protein n=1 Tax=Actinidia rufa TaxID=165716 RepID=A0A7J0DXU3_9ERIC|nr:P-loop containing nucleoside triphosphate hydrolases superfamily protein [Actinidia rufa]